MKENIFTGLLAAVLAAGAAYMRELLVPVIILAVVMLTDYVTGMVRAWITHQMSSRIGVLGIVKKVGYLFVVGVAIVVDFVIQYAAGKAGLDFGSVYFFGLLVTIWLILNECISILENLADIGVPFPGFLVKLIKRLKKTTEHKGEAAVVAIPAEDDVPDSDTAEPEQTIPGEDEL